MVCKGCLRPPLRIPSLAPSSFISSRPLLFTTSKRPLLSLSCWPTFGLNRNFWKWSFHPYRIGTVQNHRSDRATDGRPGCPHPRKSLRVHIFVRISHHEIVWPPCRLGQNWQATYRLLAEPLLDVLQTRQSQRKPTSSSGQSLVKRSSCSFLFLSSNFSSISRLPSKK